MSDELSLYDYITKFLMIQTKDGHLVHLEPNEPQKRLYEAFSRKYNAGEPCKIIILKARQMGFSTMTEAIISALTMTHSNVNSLIVAHDTDATNHIYEMAKRYYDNLPEEIKPMQKYSNRKMLTFENPSNDAGDRADNPGLKSSIRVATAGHDSIGRSMTIQYMHLSELAFWEDTQTKTTKKLLTGLLQTLPQKGQSLLIIESTANGYNYFKELWDAAYNGENDFIPLFFPWYEMSEYVRPYNGEELTADEILEKRKYKLSNEQIMWRRHAINTLCGGDLDEFKQEYPACPEEAFIVSGTPFFNAQTINRRLVELGPAGKKGNFNEQGIFEESSTGYTEIWKDVQPNHVYGIGCDTAGDGSDFFVSYVLDKTENGEQVAKYRAKTDEKLFVQQMYWLGLHYNIALLAPETNFSTYCVMKLQEMGYPNLYVREMQDTYLPKTQKKFGFRTTSLTRPLILDGLKEIVNDFPEKIQDETFFNECLSFQKDDKGKPQAVHGAHDDCVMAMAIAFYCLNQARQVFTDEDEAETNDDTSEVMSFINYGG